MEGNYIVKMEADRFYYYPQTFIWNSYDFHSFYLLPAVDPVALFILLICMIVFLH